jgi:anthranilate synthase/aminodeoxychorismate synthase-like glutamine amidotransferase
MILLIDNYDSFVHNLARYVTVLGYETRVVRNDQITLDEIKKLNPEKIIISPGPCDPNKAGISLAVIKQFGPTIPILGVCLGHQAIGQAFGGKVIKALKPMHGKASMITHQSQSIFSGLPSPLKVGRYHSLVVSQENLPDTLEILAESDQGEIMALRHKTYPVVGVQFHPESVNTEQGLALLNNFLTICLLP